MRTLYLIRHAQPTRAPGPRRCLSRTDPPLSEMGREQAAAFAGWFAAHHPGTAVYTSPAQRCRQTAALLSPAPILREDLWEMSVGAWENLTFEEIRRRWPREYAARGAHMGTTAPPGGESFCQAGARLSAFLCEILNETTGDAALVAHSGLFRGWLCGPLGINPDQILTIRQPCCGLTVVHWQDGRFWVEEPGLRPVPPGLLECAALWERCATPDAVRAHCEAVARTALALAEPFPQVDRAMLHAACLLHDLFRAEGKAHPARAAELLEAEGWPALADAVARHHDLGPAPSPEAELLYLADKQVQGSAPASWQARFQASRLKCTTPEAIRAWQRRYEDTRRLTQKYNWKTE